MRLPNRIGWSSFRLMPGVSASPVIKRQRSQLSPAHFVEPVEKDLFQALQTCEAQGPFASFTDFMQAFEPMIPTIDRFFDAVMVMADDENQKRIALGFCKGSQPCLRVWLIYPNWKVFKNVLTGIPDSVLEF